MASLEVLERSIASIRSLETIVGTMKTLSAVNIRQFEQAMTALTVYAETVEQGFQIVLRDHIDELRRNPGSGWRGAGAVVFGSEAGLCGLFNVRIVAHASDWLASEREPGSIPFMAVGVRAAEGLETIGVEPEWLLVHPSTPATLTRTVQGILQGVEEWQRRGIDRFLLFFNRPTATRGYEQVRLQLYPIDLAWLQGLARRPWRSRSLPGHASDWRELFSALVEEHLFVTCFRALAASLASEHAARLAAMQAAERNIEERLEALTREFNRQRQSDITMELFDVIAGAEALGVTGG